MTAEDKMNGLDPRERDLDAELRFDFDQRVAEKIGRGMCEGEARRAVRLEFGGIEQVKEECRDVRSWRWLEELAADTRYAARLLRRNPGFAAVALVTLALGTGATTLMFTILSGVLLHPLPFPQPGRLVRIYEKIGPIDHGTFSYPDFVDVRRENRTLSQVAAWREAGGVLREPGEAEFVYRYQVSADLFPLLGIRPLIGRAFRADEDLPGAEPVAVISYDLWQSRFGGRRGAVGARIVFDAKPWTVIGVLPKGLPLDTVFGIPASAGKAAIITAIGQFASDANVQNREMHPGIGVAGRLRSGVTLTQARADIATIASRLAAEYPKSNQGNSIESESLEQSIVGDKRSMLLLLFAAVSVILLIACANIASLLLARAASRERETTMRVALGADRGRLARQCITESVLLALGGGLLGTFIAVLGTQTFLSFWPDGLPRMDEVGFDWRVFLFALGASLLCGILFGLAPALRSPRSAGRSGARTTGGPSRRLHGAFIVSEISLAIGLLVAAGLLARAMLRLSALDPGLDPHNVVTAQMALSMQSLKTTAQRQATWEELRTRLDHIPGVVSAAFADVTPMTQANEESGYWTTPAAPPRNRMPLTLFTATSPDYTRTMGIAVRSGRYFDTQDRLGQEPVAVIDELLAHSAFAERNPLGQRIWLEFLGPVRIIGVVAHIRYWGLGADDGASVRSQIYVPLAQIPDQLSGIGVLDVFVRTKTAPLSVVPAIRTEIRREAQSQALFEVNRMEDLVRGSLAPLRFLLLLFGIFAGLALLLAAIGVYGVLAYLTSQRVPEIGVRMALGASEGNVMMLILRQGLTTILAGVGIGAIGSIAVARAMEHLDVGVRAFDPVAFGVMVAILITVALLAISIPARRASRLDPASALRHE